MRAHLYRTIFKSDASGPLEPGAQVRVLQPDSTVVITNPLYADGSSSTTISNPFTLPGATLDLYLDAPQRVDLGITPAGSSSEYIIKGQDAIVPEDISDAFLRMRFRGAWSAGTSDYEVNDAVTYGGAFWVAQGFPTTGVIPPNDADWVVVTQSRETWPLFYTGVLQTSTGTQRLYVERSVTVLSVRASVGVAPVGASIIIDVKKNGTTIFTNSAHRPTIAAGAFTALVTTIDVPSLTTGDYLTVDIVQVGSTTPGSDLTVTVEVS